MTPNAPEEMRQIPPGEALRHMRQDWHLGLRETARRADISPGRLSDIETGRRPIRPDLAARIAEAIVGAR